MDVYLPSDDPNEVVVLTATLANSLKEAYDIGVWFEWDEQNSTLNYALPAGVSDDNTIIKVMNDCMTAAFIHAGIDLAKITINGAFTFSWQGIKDAVVAAAGGSRAVFIGGLALGLIAADAFACTVNHYAAPYIN